MARLARVVVPGVPHHVTQRGNRRLETFFSDSDYRAYIALLAEHCRAAGVAVWGYCLIPDHVHLILVPSDGDGLRRALGEAHRRYTRRINFREGWRGHLWQERFHSFPMDEAWLLTAARYVELNPVRARLVKQARAWRWSSAKAHLAGKDDRLVTVAPLLERAGNWRAFLRGGMEPAALAAIRGGERTGRPLGSPEFVARLEALTGRALMPRQAGRKPAKNREERRGESAAAKVTRK